MLGNLVEELDRELWLATEFLAVESAVIKMIASRTELSAHETIFAIVFSAQSDKVIFPVWAHETCNAVLLGLSN